MALTFDITLKDILSAKPKRLFKLLTGSEEAEVLDVEFAETKLRKPDVVLQLQNGSIYHIELQSTNDKDMPLRMLEYRLHLMKQFEGKVIKQKVLYIGQPQLTMQSSIVSEDLQYKFELIDIRQLSCEELLSSDTIYDVIVAVLCSSGGELQTIRQILQKVAQIHDDNMRADIMVKLLQLSRMRRIHKVIEREVQNMPLTVVLEDEEVEQDLLYKQGLQKGLQKGMQKGIEKGIETGVEQGLRKGLAMAVQAKYGDSASELVALIEEFAHNKQLYLLYDALKASATAEQFKQYLNNLKLNQTN